MFLITYVAVPDNAARGNFSLRQQVSRRRICRTDRVWTAKNLMPILWSGMKSKGYIVWDGSGIRSAAQSLGAGKFKWTERNKCAG